MKKFDLKALNSIQIESVLDALGIEAKGRKYFCPYPHKKPQQLSIKNNMCKCYNCSEFPRDNGKFGGPVSVVQYVMGVEFKEACEWLHESFGVPYLDGIQADQTRPLPKPKKKKREIEYLTFDPFKTCNSVAIKDFMPKYRTMTEEQRIKMVYTFVYRFSLSTEQKPKFSFYKKERGIPPNNAYLQTIGYLGQEDIKEVLALLKKYFGEKDLLAFGVLKEKKNGIVFSFNYIKDGGLLMVPSFDLYTDMVTGFMVRPTHPADWMRERGVKELQLSCTSILKPLPFGLTCKALKSADTFYITEGHSDLCSIPGNINGDIQRAGIASPGTHGFREEMLSLLRGKKVVLVYDQDFSGQKAEHGYTKLTYGTKSKEHKLEFLDTKEEKAKLKEKMKTLSESGCKFDRIFHMGMKQKLRLAGVKDVEVLKWNRSWGGDINDLRINGNLSLVFHN